MTLAMLDPWIALAKEWQLLLAGVLAVVAAIILAIGIVMAAKIRAAGPKPSRKRSTSADLRASAPSPVIDGEGFDIIRSNLEKLRSLLRSALSSLSSVDANDETARVLCARIAAFEWQHFPVPSIADARLQETFATFLNQFEQLRTLLGREWSGTEASAILIQMNASARTLLDALSQRKAVNPQRAQSMTCE